MAAGSGLKMKLSTGSGGSKEARIRGRGEKCPGLARKASSLKLVSEIRKFLGSRFVFAFPARRRFLEAR